MWQKGPLPKDTYGWGAVVPHGRDMAGGFYFADFDGDKVKAFVGDKEILFQPFEVKWFDNSITLPPKDGD